ncbi:MAG: phosphoribosylformylglycinamidine cyclo-ligase [Oscillospiraceae bacterium]|jgi:phosphoribosylformylglycinamidine cyclo-ligase|nr:phosphoribosylformylglycinamidine cyclo-ligase [Oscillospiraceae bacterium]
MSKAYTQAGVDVEAGYKAVALMKKHVESTQTKGVLGGIGGFGGLFEPDLTGLRRPVLVSGTDGVGTKLKIAFVLDKHDTVGIDCVAMCVNDVVCAGAAPLFFLDYIACGKNTPEKIAAIVSGMAAGCREAGCALVGGETAEMPGFYAQEEYDLAGFCVGLVDYEQRIDGRHIAEGDLLIGLSSSGVHANGFSLVRRVLGEGEGALGRHYNELGCTLGEELLKPTRIYVRPLLRLMKKVKVKGISHITGGGFIENVPRMLPQGLCAAIEPHSFPEHPIFDIIKREGRIPPRDMYGTFNMGIGLVIAVDKKDGGEAVTTLVEAGEHPYMIGVVRRGEGGVSLW